MNPREHQKLVRDNIAVAVSAGDHARATVLRTVYRELLAIEFPPIEPERVPASPINTISLPNVGGAQ